MGDASGSPPPIADRVAVVLAQGFGIDDVTPDLELLEEGYLDSPAIVELVLALEQTFGITLDEEFITPENFASPQSIADLVESCR